MNQKVGRRKLNAEKPKWDAFVPGTLPPFSVDKMKAQAAHLGVPLEQIIAVHNDITKHERVFINSLYQVNVRKNPPMQSGWPDMIHLSIKRRDKAPIHDWRDLQRIKNELVGPEYEGIELYPAESRLVDTANQYHIWVFMDPAFKLNVGFKDGRMVTDHSNETGAVQRPFEK